MLLAVVFSLFFQSAANASFIPYGAEKHNPGTTITIQGKGITARQSNDNLALICETPSCDTLRYGILNPDGIHVFGPTMSKSLLGSGIEINRMLPNQSAGRGGLTLFLLTGGSIFLAPVTTIPVLVLLGIDAIIAVSGDQTENLKPFDVIGHISRAARTLKPATKEGQAFLDQAGWNWSISPKKVSRKRYCETIASILDIPKEFNGGYCDIRVDANTTACDYNGFVNACRDSL